MEGLNSYDAAILAAAFIAGVGVIVLGLELRAALRWFAEQPEREIRYLTDWWMYDDGDSLLGILNAYRESASKRARAFAPDPIDYVDDLPFVTPSPSLREQFAAAPLYAYDQPTSRPDDRFDGMRGADGCLDLENASPCDLAAFYGYDSEQQA